MIPIPLIAFPIALLASLLLSGGTAFWGYEHGISIQEARQTKAELANANATIAKMGDEQKNAAKAGENHDEHAVQIVHDTREIVRTVTLPPDADVYLPVGFVRMFDRAASRYIGADPYPGKSDGDPSDVKVSEAQTLLADNYGSVCEANRSQLSDLIAYIKDANSRREDIKPKSILDRLGL